MIMNRIADIFFILAIIILFEKFKTLDFIIIFAVLPSIFHRHLIF